MNKRTRAEWEAKPVVTLHLLYVRFKSNSTVAAALSYLPTVLVRTLSHSVPEIAYPLAMLHLQKCEINKASHFQNI